MVNLRAGIVRSAAGVGVAAALLVGAALGCGAQSSAESSDQLVYDVGTANGSTRAGLFMVDDHGGNRRRLTGPPPPSSASYAAWSPQGGTILFQSDLEAEEEFWTIEADGTGLRLVGRGAGATWSPDGREIAIIEGNDEISIVGRDGSPHRTIRLGLEHGKYPDLAAYWSPDGSRIALDVDEPDTTAHVAVVAADGKSPARVIRDDSAPQVSDSFADWSPDGNSIAFIHGNEDEPGSAWVMRSDGSGRRLVAAHAEGVAFSADGKSFLYVSGYPEERALYRVPITGGEPQKIGPAPKNGLTNDPLVEPGGKRVIDLLAGTLVVRDAHGTARDLLTEPHEDSSPLWSPDGERIAFLRGSEDKWDVYVVGANGKGERRICADGFPVWLRDGRLLIGRAKGFSFADLDPNRLAMPVDGESPAVSPDGQWVAFNRNRAVHTGSVKPPDSDLQDVQSTLFVQRSDGTGVRELAKTPGSAYRPLVFDAPAWTPDGRSIFIAQRDPLGGVSGSISQVDVRDGSERTVASDEASDLELLAVAPDGKRIAFATGMGIDVVQLDDLERKTLVPLERVSALELKWSPDGRKLAYIAENFEQESVYDLYVVDADGSHRRLVSKPGDAVGTFDWRRSAPSS